MLFRLPIKTLLASAIFVAVPAMAEEPEPLTFSNAINASSWSLDSSVFSCEMHHKVPYYGEATVRTRAGEQSSLFLRGKTSRFLAGEAEIWSRSPVWVEGGESEKLGLVQLRAGTSPIWLSTAMTEQILKQLNQGHEVEFTKATWFENEANPVARLALSNIGFRGTYKKYLACITQLLPANFDQLKRSVLYFPAGDVKELPGEARKILDEIILLLKHDHKVRMLYVDGHTDSAGDPKDNLEISKVRATMVRDYLTRHGVAENLITLRWHGERYPVTSNATEKGRARNRRVTVRLEKAAKPTQQASAAETKK